MCLATVACCDSCQQESCCVLDICPEAKRSGMIHLAKSMLNTKLNLGVTELQNDVCLLNIHSILQQQRVRTPHCGRCKRMSDPKLGPPRPDQIKPQWSMEELAGSLDAITKSNRLFPSMILSKLNELSHEITCLKMENSTLKKDNMSLRDYHDVLRNDVHQLKSSQIFRHVGEHDDRLAEVDQELEDLKLVLDEHSKSIGRYGIAQNATRELRKDDMRAKLEHHLGMVEDSESQEDARGRMQIDAAKKDAIDEADWETVA